VTTTSVRLPVEVIVREAWSVCACDDGAHTFADKTGCLTKDEAAALMGLPGLSYRHVLHHITTIQETSA